MQAIRKNLMLAFFIATGFSTIANTLFYVDVISKDYVQIGFLLVMLCSIVLNFLSMNKKTKELVKIEAEKTSKLTKTVTIALLILWVVTYGMALFLK